MYEYKNYRSFGTILRFFITKIVLNMHISVSFLKEKNVFLSVTWPPRILWCNPAFIEVFGGIRWGVQAEAYVVLVA